MYSYQLMTFKKERKRKNNKTLFFFSFPYSRLDVPWVSDILIPVMIAILSRRVIASKYVWVCYWKLRPFNVLI